MSNTQSSPDVLVIEMINQQPSNFVLDGANEEDADLPSNISAPNAWKLKNVSRVVVEEKDEKTGKMVRRHKTIRYIAGCDIIDKEEQDRMGIKPNPAHDTIWILNGKLTVIRSGSDIGKYDFIKNHENNASNPNQPEGAVNRFKEIDTTVAATKMEDLFDQERKILNYLDGLKTKKGNGYEYNVDALTFLCQLFKLPLPEITSPSEAWVEVAMYAKEAPAKFLTSLANQKSIVEAEVNQALSKGVITIDDSRAVLTDSRKVIMGFSSNETNDEKRNKLVDYMTNPKHRLFYDQMRSELHAKTMKAASVIE